MDTLLVLLRASRDPDGNLATIAVVAATPSTHSREPTGSIVETIERQVERQNQQIDAAIQELGPNRPDPLIATESFSIISGITNPAMSPSFTSIISSLPSLDLTVPTEW